MILNRLNNYCYLLYALLLFSSSALASLPPPFVIDQPLNSQRITIYTEYLSDPDAALSLNNIRSSDYSDRFKPASHSRERLGFQDTVWWIRFALENRTQEKMRLVAELEPGNVAEIAFFRPGPSGYSSQFSGSKMEVPWADLHDRNQVYLLELEAEEHAVYYMRIEPNHSFNYQLAIHSLPAQIEDSRREDTAFLLLFGILSGLALYNLGISFVSREVAPLAYAAFLGSINLSIALAEGILGIQYLQMGSLYPRIELISQLITCAAALFFASTFLDLKNMIPRLHKITHVSLLICLLLALLMFSVPVVPGGKITYVGSGIVALYLLSLGYIAWQKELPEGNAFFLSRWFQVGGFLFVFLNMYGFMQTGIELSFAMLVSVTLEGAVIAIALTRKNRRTLTHSLHEEQRIAIEETTLSTRNETLSRMSHEIRTPMSGILGMAEILNDTPLTPNQKECVRTIQSSGQNLLKIINDVLEYSRLESGDTKLNRETFNLAEILMEAVELFRERAEEKNVEIITNIHTNVPRNVEGDSVRLRQVLTNILGASLRVAGAGELIVEIGHDPSGQTHHLRFELEGSAISHAGDQLNALVEGNPDEDSQTSISLSLSIVRQLTEAMRGRTAIREARQRGLVYSFSLPLPAAEEQEIETNGASLQLLPGRSMLVVDDSSTVTRVLKQQALSWGMKVTACHDSREALASIRTQANLDEPYDIVVLDHHMPGMNGMQLATRIHEDPVITNAVVLVMLTGIQDAPTSTMARNVGIHRVLSKPVSGHQLQRVLAEELQHVHSRKRSQYSHLDIDPGLRVLVAEDHQLSQKIILGMLAKLQINADLVVNGKEAVQAVHYKKYDIILMDCEMPELDGFKATAQIREWEKKQGIPRVPILALTAHILKEHKEKSLQSGMDAHIPKPVELNSLKEAIIQWTSARSIHID